MQAKRFLPLAVLMCWFPRATIAAPIVWTNSTGGSWTNAANWSPNQVPTASDHEKARPGGEHYGPHLR